MVFENQKQYNNHIIYIDNQEKFTNTILEKLEELGLLNKNNNNSKNDELNENELEDNQDNDDNENQNREDNSETNIEMQTIETDVEQSLST